LLSSYELQYERGFEMKDASTVKIKKYYTPPGAGAAGARRQEHSQMLRPYTGENIEELFYTVDCFCNLETDMPGFEEGDLIPQFPLLLSDQTARREWQRWI